MNSRRRSLGGGQTLTGIFNKVDPHLDQITSMGQDVEISFMIKLEVYFTQEVFGQGQGLINRFCNTGIE